MNLNQRCGTDVFLLESCLVVVQAFILTVIKIYFKCISGRDDLYIDLTYFILELFSLQR
jgi:hypothetical protein